MRDGIKQEKRETLEYLREGMVEEEGGGAADRPNNYDSRTRELPIPGRFYESRPGADA